MIIAGSESAKSIIAIDHSYVFSTLAYDQLNPKFVASSYNDSILLAELGESISRNTTFNKSWFNKMEERFYLYIENCKNHYNEIASYIPLELGFADQLKKCVSDFLFDETRNAKVFEEFVSRF